MNTKLPPPMRIGQLMDRVFQLLPQLIKPLLPSILAISALATIGTHLNFEIQQKGNIIESLMLLIPVSILQWILFYYFMVLTIVLSDSLWLSGVVNSTQGRSQVTFGKMLRSFFLGWIILMASLAWAILLIIPGIIYFMNRVPAINILLLENTSIRESLRKSKALMTHYPGIPWYSFHTPMMRISAIMLVSMILNLMPAMISGTNVFFNSFQGQMPISSYLDYFINFVASFLTVLFSTFGYLANVGFYYDLLTRAQGIDLKYEIAALKTV